MSRPRRKLFSRLALILLIEPMLTVMTAIAGGVAVANSSWDVQIPCFVVIFFTAIWRYLFFPFMLFEEKKNEIPPWLRPENNMDTEDVLDRLTTVLKQYETSRGAICGMVFFSVEQASTGFNQRYDWDGKQFVLKDNPWPEGK